MRHYQHTPSNRTLEIQRETLTLREGAFIETPALLHTTYREEHVIPYNGHSVLYLQYDEGVRALHAKDVPAQSNYHVLVPGYIIRREGHESSIMIIPPHEREALEKIIAERTHGPITFWEE